MEFFFNATKALQAAAALLRHEETKRMSYLRLLKLLYVADRESMRETGRPITGDRAFAMEHGPVLDGVYNLIKGVGYHAPGWAKHFQVTDYYIKLTKDPGTGLLSRHELEKLREARERYALKNDWEIVGDTHRFEEWKRNYVEGTSQRIPVEQILKAVGRGSDIPEIEQDEKDREKIDRILKDW